MYDACSTSVFVSSDVAVDAAHPRHRVRADRARRAAVRHHLEDVEPGEAGETRAEPQLAVHVRAPRVARREILEADRRHLAPLERVGRVDVDANDVRRVAIERRELHHALRHVLREAELVGVRVLGAQVRIADEHVLHVEERRERIQLLRARATNAARVARLHLRSCRSGCTITTPLGNRLA